MNKDKYYVDYRIGAIVKNLDVTYLAPEMWNEIVVDESKSGSYSYTYVNEQGKHLTFSFTQDQIDNVTDFNYREKLNAYAKENNFEICHIVDKKMFLSREVFNRLNNKY